MPSLLIFVIFRIIPIGSVKPARIIFITPTVSCIIARPLVEGEEVRAAPVSVHK